MKLSIDLSVKFRVFFITLGTVTRHYEQPIPFPLPGVSPRPLFGVDDRGVQLVVALVAG